MEVTRLNQLKQVECWATHSPQSKTENTIEQILQKIRITKSPEDLKYQWFNLCFYLRLTEARKASDLKQEDVAQAILWIFQNRINAASGIENIHGTKLIW